MEKKIANITVKSIMLYIIKTPTMAKANDKIDDVLKKIIEDPRTRHAYITDNSGKLIGSLRINNIIAYMFPDTVFIEEYGSIPVSSFVDYSNAKYVKDIMNTDPSYLFEESTLQEMVQIMLSEKVNELPVVDKELKVIGEVNILELITYYLQKKNVKKD